jgi:hypothetical protein
MDNLTNNIKEALRGRKFKLVPTPGGEAEFESDVVYIPDFEMLVKDLNKALETLSGMATTDDIRKDEQFLTYIKEYRELRNRIRTHLRKVYPTEYNSIKGLFEMTGTGGGAGAAGFQVGKGPQYGAKYAYKLAPKAKKLGEANPGASLGKGPKAGATGVKNNYYTKAFGFKPVDSKKLATQSKAIDTKYLWGK